MNKIKLDNKEFYYQVFYKRIKNMYLRVNQEGILTVTCNKQITHERIENFIQQHSLKILKKINERSTSVPLYNQTEMDIFGVTYQILHQLNCPKNRFQINENFIDICFKRDHFDNQYVESIYKELLIGKMEEILKRISPDISKHFNLDGIVLKAQLMKSRYGSCQPKDKIIKLNTILARFPEMYTEVILVHELIHLKVHNHQQEFYQYMNLLIPEYRQYKKELNQLSRKYVI